MVTGWQAYIVFQHYLCYFIQNWWKKLSVRGWLILRNCVPSASLITDMCTLRQRVHDYTLLSRSCSPGVGCPGVVPEWPRPSCGAHLHLLHELRRVLRRPPVSVLPHRQQQRLETRRHVHPTETRRRRWDELLWRQTIGARVNKAASMLTAASTHKSHQADRVNISSKRSRRVSENTWLACW